MKKKLMLLCNPLYIVIGVFSKKVMSPFLFLIITAVLNASPLYYTFEGVITNYRSYNDSVSFSDFDVVLGETEVTYVFEVDFDRDVHSYTNTAGTWHYCYSDLLEGGIVNGELPESNTSFNWYGIKRNMGEITGGSRVDVLTTDTITPFWKVQDWYIGQEFSLNDGGYLSIGGGGAVYFDGTVELTSIVPEPTTLLLLSIGGLVLRKRRK